jgi:hypothetical protein
LRNIKLITKLIELDTSFSINFASKLWEQIQDQEVPSSEKQPAFIAINNYIKQCPANTYKQILQKENLIKRVTEARKQRSSTSSNHRLLSDFGVYHAPRNNDDSEIKNDKPVNKLTK